MLYNYYLDGNKYEEGVKCDLNLLTPPSDKRYTDKFINDVLVQNFSFCKDEGHMPCDLILITADNDVYEEYEVAVDIIGLCGGINL